MPRSPGAWRYAASGGRTTATFVSPAGAPLSRLVCFPDSRSVVLSLPESGVRGALVTIRTETASRAFEARRGDRDMSIALSASATSDFPDPVGVLRMTDRKSTRLNSSH